MSERRLPPYPLGGDWRSWARQLIEYLNSEARSEEFVAPRAVGLLHQVPNDQAYRTLEDGILMFNPNLGVPVYSHGGSWNQFTAQGDLNYLVTDDAGNGTVVDDINNTDFTGQTGAIGACAQCPVATNVAFYHKGVQYLYTGPTPASYGLNCPDTMQDSYLIPTGVGTFLALTDTPDAYAGFANYWPRVNPAEDALLFDQIEEADIINFDRVKWRGNWVQQTYNKNDMVLGDANWLMIANKTTTDVAPPRPTGNPLWDMSDAPIWASNSFNGVVKSGREWQITKPIDVRGLAVWIPTVTGDTNYVLFAYRYPTGQPDQLTAIQISEPLLVAGQWTVVSLNRQLFPAGTTFGFLIDGLNSGSDTFVTGGWGRAANTNDGLVDPGTGQWNTNNANTRVGLSYTDLDTTDRTSELQGVIAGSTIQVVQTDDASKSVSWTVNADGIDRTTHIDFANVTLADTGPNGQPDVAAVCTVTITVPVPQPTDYVQIVGGNPTHTWGTSRGTLELGGVPQSVDADAFGVRILADEYVTSPDWDIANAVGAGGGGGGGSGGASKFTELGDTPADYAGQAGKFAQVATEEDRLIFEAITSGATVGDTFPVTPQAGQLHFKTGKHIGLYIWYEDADSSQWVQTNGGGLDLIDEPYKVVHTATTADFTDYSSTTTTNYAANGSRCWYVPKYKNTHVLITGETYWRNTTNNVDDWDVRGNVRHYDGAAFIDHAPQMNGTGITGIGSRLQFRITNTNTTTNGDVYTSPEPFKWWFPPGYGRFVDTIYSPNGHEVVYPLIGFSGTYAGTKYMLQTNFYIEEVLIRDTSDISFTFNAPNDRVEQPDYPNWEP